MKTAPGYRPVQIIIVLVFMSFHTAIGSPAAPLINYPGPDTAANYRAGLGYTAMSACAGIVKEYAAHKKMDTSYAILLDHTTETGRTRFYVFELSGFTIVKYGLLGEARNISAMSFNGSHTIPVFSVKKNTEGLLVSVASRADEKELALLAMNEQHH